MHDLCLLLTASLSLSLSLFLFLFLCLAVGPGILDHHHIFFFGDLNYRVDELSYDEVKEQVTAGSFLQLLHVEQLQREHKVHTAVGHACARPLAPRLCDCCRNPRSSMTSTTTTTTTTTATHITLDRRQPPPATTATIAAATLFSVLCYLPRTAT